MPDSSSGKDLTFSGDGFECGHHVGWFKVERGRATCTLVLVYVSIRLRETVKFSSVKRDSAQQTPSQHISSLPSRVE